MEGKHPEITDRDVHLIIFKYCDKKECYKLTFSSQSNIKEKFPLTKHRQTHIANMLDVPNRKD